MTDASGALVGLVAAALSGGAVGLLVSVVLFA